MLPELLRIRKIARRQRVCCECNLTVMTKVLFVLSKGDVLLDWKDIRIENVDSIEKCVAEFEITALRFFEELFVGDIIHYGLFKVKIYESQTSPYFSGFTNLRIRSPEGGYEGGYGSGISIELALENTVRNFMGDLMEYKRQKQSGLCEDDLVLLPYDEY